MKYSRTYQTCQNVVLCLLDEFGFKDTYHNAEVDKAIQKGAGGDHRTLARYQNTLIHLDFLVPQQDGLVSINLTKLDYQQLKIHESLKVLAQDEPP